MATMENDKVVYLTQEGLNRLQAELEVLRNKRRPEVAERIRQAKEFGDINENAEYDDAKNEQGFVEGRILLLEKLVRNASIIEGKHVKGVVEVGSTVKVAVSPAASTLWPMAMHITAGTGSCQTCWRWVFSAQICKVWTQPIS